MATTLPDFNAQVVLPLRQAYRFRVAGASFALGQQFAMGADDNVAKNRVLSQGRYVNPLNASQTAADFTDITSGSPPPPPATPPVLQGLSPSDQTVQAGTIALSAIGSYFDPAAKLVFNSAEYATTGSATVRTAQVPLATFGPGSYVVAVRNPGPVDSNAVNFTVRP